MDNLYIEATKYTPEIFFDFQHHTLSIKGESYPENTAEFYAPVFEWLRYYSELGIEDPITVNIEIIYFNSSTSKVFMDLFDQFEESFQAGKNIVVNWIYLEDDDNILEYGEEFKEDLKELPFNLVPIKETNS